MSVWRNENEAQQPVVRVPFFGAGSNPATLTLNITFVLKIEGMAMASVGQAFNRLRLETRVKSDATSQARRSVTPSGR